MQLIWIILRYLFPRDPLRQGAEVLRQRIAQLAHMARDPATLRQLFFDPASRLQLEFLILDVEDCLRLWIAMRGCQIAKIRPKPPRRRCTPHLTHARDPRDLITRIHTLVATFAKREKLAHAHAEKLKRLRDANPLGLAAPSSLRHAATQHATSPAFQAEEEKNRRLSSSGKAGGGGLRALARKTEGAAAAARAPPVFDVFLKLKPASQATPAGSRPHAQLAPTPVIANLPANPEGL